MAKIKAVTVDPEATGRLTISEVEEPAATHSEALVKVEAISLNRGEVRRAGMSEAGWRPGWDLAGTVLEAAADGTGPAKGARVVGFKGEGAWAEVVAVPTHSLAELPDNVSFAQAATLPVAGLTALYSLEMGGLLLDRQVLITGASGGVGLFAVELARLAGARVIGAVSKAAHAATVKEAGAEDVVVGEDLSQAGKFGKYNLILESVGGKSLTTALSLLAADGKCVLFGASGGGEATLDVRSFFNAGGASLYGFILFHEVKTRPAGQGLARLARLVGDGKLHPRIDVEAPWTQVGEVANKLINREFTGKAVLHLKE
ncbi:MAG TPA: zinc-binding dehydrogenase [Chloroflexia bacterium]|nr:zinc-binding dehydrogenase [Chloroflexia bacterium]